jgi:glutamate N-acetyltransferase/amino-acid N-acetyltransferase
MPARSPLAPDRFPDLPPVAGARLAAVATGMRYKGRDDVMLIELAVGSTMAAAFTRSETAAAPVLWGRTQARGGRVRAMICNAGNANAFTGKDGDRAVRATARAAARLLGCTEGEVFPASTGVIGVKLPVDKLTAALPDLHRTLDAGAWARAAGAIMTTDTFAKGATRRARIGGAEVTINGIAKGSGMIAPDMATVLAYIVTDAKLPVSVLRALLRDGLGRSFNAITVDGDTSTSDSVYLCATGATKHTTIKSAGDRALEEFRAQLDSLLIDLAQQIVRDGEGARKFVTLTVRGARKVSDARRVALTIANSPLVKTALAAGDANWGRVVAAAGRAGVRLAFDRLKVSMGGVLIAARGGPVPGYDEAPVARHLAGREVAIEVDLGLGGASATVWTCDLTHGYIDINGSYRS